MAVVIPCLFELGKDDKPLWLRHREMITDIEKAINTNPEAKRILAKKAKQPMRRKPL